jgi:signal peptidase I
MVQPLNGRKNLTESLKELWKNEYFRTAVIVGLVALVVLGFWYGSQAVLNTNYPALAVVSGSMCIPYDGACDGWASLNHPFEKTLHKGDLIIVQGMNPADLNANYPNSDIIVFHKPTDPEELIVHRIIASQEIDGTLYFVTKGDGNGNKWPSTPEYGIDNWGSSYPYGVPQNLVAGKVVMRVPWIGHVVLFMRSSIGVPIVILIVVSMIVAEFVFTMLRKEKRQPPEAGNSLQK